MRGGSGWGVRYGSQIARRELYKRGGSECQKVQQHRKLQRQALRHCQCIEGFEKGRRSDLFPTVTPFPLVCSAHDAVLPFLVCLHLGTTSVASTYHLARLSLLTGQNIPNQSLPCAALMSHCTVFRSLRLRGAWIQLGSVDLYGISFLD